MPLNENLFWLSYGEIRQHHYSETVMHIWGCLAPISGNLARDGARKKNSTTIALTTLWIEREVQIFVAAVSLFFNFKNKSGCGRLVITGKKKSGCFSICLESGKIRS